MIGHVHLFEQACVIVSQEKKMTGRHWISTKNSRENTDNEYSFFIQFFVGLQENLCPEINTQNVFKSLYLSDFYLQMHRTIGLPNAIMRRKWIFLFCWHYSTIKFRSMTDQQIQVLCQALTYCPGITKTYLSPARQLKLQEYF